MEIKHSDIEKKYRVQIDTRETLVYKLKSGKYFLDKQILERNWNGKGDKYHSELDNVKPISAKEAEELISFFQKKREDFGQEWPDPE